MNRYKKMDIDNIEKLKKLSTLIQIASFLGIIFTGPNFIGATLLTTYSVAYIEKFRMYSGIKNNDSVNELKKIYDEIINDIIKLSYELENEELLEHYELLSFIYNNCYLNYEHEFGIEKEMKNEINLLKELSLNGHGVCRHTSSMCADYLEKIGYDSKLLTGYLKFDNENYINNALEYFKSINKEVTREELLSYVEQNGEDDKLKLLKQVVGNHAICMSNDNNYSYYLDITNNCIYAPINKIILFDGNYMTINLTKTNRLIDKGKKIENKHTMELPDMKSIINNTDMKLLNNIDMIEKFSKENKDKLEEAENIYKKLCK